MIGKVDTALPNSLADVDLRQHDSEKTKLKKNGSKGAPDSESAAAEREEPLTTMPVNIRFLGKKLDLIA